MNLATQTKPAMAPEDATSRDCFDLWAPVYDSQLNPVVALEERYLAAVLPTVRGLDIVDVGCGTGRWLNRLANQGANSLTGLDSSPAMVDRAREKLGKSAVILQADAAALPLAADSCDLIMAAFVASHLQDLSGFANEIRRVARDGASVFFSDLHPETAGECNWKRGFNVNGNDVEFATYGRSIAKVISCFDSHGFEAVLLLEPSFESPERETFRLAGKEAAFQAVTNKPAIYILQLKLTEVRRAPRTHQADVEPELKLVGVRVAFGPGESAHAGIEILGKEIASVGCCNHAFANAPRPRTLNLDGYLVLPGLINSHDHLEFGLFPNLGHGPYASFSQWAEDIHQADRNVIAQHQKVPKGVRLWWGAIRNLLCGVTTVCHHNPFDPVFNDAAFPVRVLSKFGWAHSVAMDPDLVRKFHDTPPDVPFILHAAEGVDVGNTREVFELDRVGILDERTVLVHGLGLTADGIELANRRGAALVWCPTSNEFLFGQTHTRQALGSIHKLLLGSDSPLTAAGDLLDEVRDAHTNVNVSPDELYRMVITRPASIFRFDDGRGRIRPDASADLIAVGDSGARPAEILAQMSWKQVELVVVTGRVQLASNTLLERLPTEMTRGLQPLEYDGHLRWIRAPLGRLFREAHKALGCDITLGNKKVRYAGAEWL